MGTSEITQRQRVRIGVGWEVVRWHLEGMYGEVEEDVVDERPVFVVSRDLLGVDGLVIVILTNIVAHIGNERDLDRAGLGARTIARVVF